MENETFLLMDASRVLMASPFRQSKQPAASLLAPAFARITVNIAQDGAIDSCMRCITRAVRGRNVGIIPPHATAQPQTMPGQKLAAAVIQLNLDGLMGEFVLKE
jgi:hypothetical protein